MSMAKAILDNIAFRSCQLICCFKHAIDGWKYTNGQFVKQQADYKTFEHTGDWLRTSTFYARVPENKISVAVFCNNVDLDAAKFGIRVLNTAHKYFK
jgi:predicted transcriptional regulator YheO